MRPSVITTGGKIGHKRIKYIEFYSDPSNTVAYLVVQTHLHGLVVTLGHDVELWRTAEQRREWMEGTTVTVWARFKGKKQQQGCRHCRKDAEEKHQIGRRCHALQRQGQ